MKKPAAKKTPPTPPTHSLIATRVGNAQISPLPWRAMRYNGDQAVFAVDGSVVATCESADEPSIANLAMTANDAIVLAAAGALRDALMNVLDSGTHCAKTGTRPADDHCSCAYCDARSIARSLLTSINRRLVVVTSER